MRIVFDLDCTICKPKQNPLDDYYALEPFPEAVEFLSWLKTNNHYIIIHTARGMVTYGECLEDIYHVHYDAIADWLDRWQIPYNELIIGKPFADFYVDDKAVSHSDWSATAEFFHQHLSNENSL